MPFENPQAAAAPTRRSSRHRTAATEAPATGTTAPLAHAETVVALAAVAPLSRRAARQRPNDVPPVPQAPAEPFIAATPAPAVADVPAVPLAATHEAPAEAAGAEVIPPASEPFVAEADAEGDAFERASRAFRSTGAVRTVPAAAASARSFASAADAQGAAAEHVASRPRRLRRFVTVGATVGVMGLAGLLAVSMTLPAEAVAAARGGSMASTSLVTAAAADAAGSAKDEIQAFVAPSDVQNAPLTRNDDYSTVSLVEVAAEQGINYSGEVFTNDPDAAIQWPFMVGVGMSYGYGMRSGRLHEGIDFTPGNGAPIQAIADGVVRTATEQGGAYGVTVYIDHVIDGQTITSHYAHMQYGSLQVKAGDRVTVGTVIGKTGNTGRSYGAHLHFELIVNGTTIDPMPWLRANAGRTSY